MCNVYKYIVRSGDCLKHDKWLWPMASVCAVRCARVCRRKWRTAGANMKRQPGRMCGSRLFSVTPRFAVPALRTKEYGIQRNAYMNGANMSVRKRLEL